MTGGTSSPVLIHASWRNSGRRPRILSRVARPSPSPSAHGASRARAVRPRAAPPGRARGQGSAPIAHHCYCTRFAASAGAGGGDGGERGTVGTDGTDGTDGADGAGGTTNCRRCADGLRRGLGSFTIGKPALRPSPAAGACHVGSVPKRLYFFLFGKIWIKRPPLSSEFSYFSILFPDLSLSNRGCFRRGRSTLEPWGLDQYSSPPKDLKVHSGPRVTHVGYPSRPSPEGTEVCTRLTVDFR